MTGTRRSVLNQRLYDRRRELQRDLDAKLRDVRANNGYDGDTLGGLDTAEHSDAELQQDIDISLIEMKTEALRHVADALARLASGDYGYCEECGGEISEKRLEALPFAVRCRECEVVHETGARRSRRITETRLESLKCFAECEETGLPSAVVSASSAMRDRRL
jgi:DnaK suppressor protein